MSGVDHRDRNNTGLERSELNLLFTAQVVLQTAMPIAYPMIPPWANLYFACFVFPQARDHTEAQCIFSLTRQQAYLNILGVTRFHHNKWGLQGRSGPQE